MANSLLEISLIEAIIIPVVLSIALRNAVYILPDISISIKKLLFAKAILQSIRKIALVFIFPQIDSKAMRQAAMPMSRIHFIIAIAKPIVASFSLLNIILELPYVDIPINIYL